MTVLALLTLVTCRWNEAAKGSVEGPAVVLDGDTLLVAEKRVRLRGIDAPELDQTCRRAGTGYACGREARRELIRLIGGARVTCDTYGYDGYGRVLVECAAGETPLNARMVERGWAVAYGEYEGLERTARDAGQGIWAGEFDLPEDWRRAHGRDGEPRAGGIRGWLRMLFGG